MNRGDEVGPLNRATCTDVVTKSRTTLYFLQQMFATIKNLICCNTGLKVGGKTSNIAIQLVCSNVAKQVARFCWPFLPPEYMTLYSMIKRVPWTFTLRTQLTRLFEAPPSTGHCNCFIPAACFVKTFLLCYAIISTFHTFRWSNGTKSNR